MKRLVFLTPLLFTFMLSFGTAEEDREAAPRFKGVELYSWRTEEGGFVYVLASGTNRIKPEAEIKALEKLRGEAELKKALQKLAKGEHVFWTQRGEGFDYPAKMILEEIQAAAKEAEINLHTPLPGKE